MIVCYKSGSIVLNSFEATYLRALKAFSDGACAVVADSLFHNLTVLGKNENACWSILEWGM